MKVLYCNPVSLDYRIPFYKELNRLFDGDFYFLFSSARYIQKGRKDLLSKMKDELGVNAISYDSEKIFNTATMSFEKYCSENGHRIPFAFGLLRLIRRETPDVLITEGFLQWTPLLVLYSIIHKIPLFIGYERTPWTERNTKWWHTLQRKLTDKFARGYLVNGSETKRYLKSIGISEEKIFIGGMSADGANLMNDAKRFKDSVDYFSFKNQYKNIDTNSDGILYLFSGQMVVRKGVKYLLHAWRSHIVNHPSDSLVLVGDGVLLDEFRNEFSDVGSIHLIGKVPYVEVYKYYAIADVFVLPTIEDNWSLVVPEAMACGLPIATSIYNGCYPELVHKDENGIIFDTFKEETIIEALDYFHHVDLKAFGEKSIELERIFNTENSARREYFGILKGLNMSI